MTDEERKCLEDLAAGHDQWATEYGTPKTRSTPRPGMEAAHRAAARAIRSLIDPPAADLERAAQGLWYFDHRLEWVRAAEILRQEYRARAASVVAAFRGEVEPSPAAANVARPPANYVECSLKCGRWTDGGLCWNCFYSSTDNAAVRAETAGDLVGNPDWIQPTSEGSAGK